jgi:biopolymer transport protein ExbD
VTPVADGNRYEMTFTMRLSKTKRSHALAFNLTPMIDIVFLLIIFFMTVSQITRVVDQPVFLPIVHAGSSDASVVAATLNINAAGQIIVAGKTYTLERVAAILQEKLSNLGGDVQRLKIEIRCDRRCPSQHVNRIFDQLAELKIPFVRIAVTGDN